MAAISTSVSVAAAPLAFATQNRAFSPLPSRAAARPRVVRARASLRERAATGLAAAALTASMAVPDVAMAAESGALTPSLKNFLLSIAAGGIVLTAIIGAVVGVSNFDPVNRS